MPIYSIASPFVEAHQRRHSASTQRIRWFIVGVIVGDIATLIALRWMS